LYRGGTYTKQEASKLYAQIYQGRFKYDIIRLQPEQLDKVIPLVFNVPVALRLRTLDAIHLVVARQMQADISKIAPSLSFIFVSSGGQLLKVAQALGFVTENEDYP
jgi:hypothetical protein